MKAQIPRQLLIVKRPMVLLLAMGLLAAGGVVAPPAEAALRRAIQIEPSYGSAHNNLAVIYLMQQPPSFELARWHYQKALASGHPRNSELEKMLDANKIAEKGQ